MENLFIFAEKIYVCVKQITCVALESGDSIIYCLSNFIVFLYIWKHTYWTDNSLIQYSKIIIKDNGTQLNHQIVKICQSPIAFSV